MRCSPVRVAAAVCATERRATQGLRLAARVASVLSAAPAGMTQPRADGSDDTRGRYCAKERTGGCRSRSRPIVGSTRPSCEYAVNVRVASSLRPARGIRRRGRATRTASEGCLRAFLLGFRVQSLPSWQVRGSAGVSKSLSSLRAPTFAIKAVLVGTEERCGLDPCSTLSALSCVFSFF